MEPTLWPGDRLVVVPRGLVPLRRGSLVEVTDPRDRDRRTVKRVVGLPGEEVELRDGSLWVDGVAVDEPYLATRGNEGARWQLGARQLVVLGDNRAASTDSRTYGPVATTDVTAVVAASLRPARWLLPPA